MKQKTYKVINGTSFDARTPDKVAKVLDQCRQMGNRIRLHYGFEDKNWMEENDIIGYVGRSTGTIKIPILVYNSRSLGGGGILDHCIIAIQDTKTGRYLYKADHFKLPDIQVHSTSDYPELPYEAIVNGELQARFSSYKKAWNWKYFMEGKRMSK